MVRFNELKEKWAFVFSEEKLLDLINEIYETLTYYNHNATKYGVMCLLDKYIDMKKELIELIMKHPLYNGNLQVVIPTGFDRENNYEDIEKFIENFNKKIKAKSYILSKKNKDGKTLQDIIKENIVVPTKTIKINDICNVKASDVVVSDIFDKSGYTKESVSEYNLFLKTLSYFREETNSTLSKRCADFLNEKYANAKLRFTEGMKTSRAFNRVCTYFRLNLTKNYGKLQAQYGDMINEFKRTLNYVISVNPLDYLKMSFGNTWSSCHTIDKQNKRKSSGSTYSGGYCGGTISYMLDSTSIINYVVPVEVKDVSSTERPDRWDKIYRNMFHLQNKQLVQGRVYPQDKDGATDLYKLMRFVMQKALCEMYGIEYIDSGNGNDTWISKGSTYDCTSWVKGKGAHYPDYIRFSYCNLSYIRGVENTFPIEIGNDGIDVHSGLKLSECSLLTYGVDEDLPNEVYISGDISTYMPI